MAKTKDKLNVGKPGESAAGVRAVAVVLKRTAAEAGLRRGATALLRLNQRDGFDCPGCAWPDADKRKTFEFCENGAKAVADEATRKRIGPEFFERWTVPELQAKEPRWLNAQGRLTHPMWLEPGAARYRPVSWRRAYRLIADALGQLDSPDQAAFYTSGRTSNEAAFVYQLFVRKFGTNNFPDCSNLCHESSGYALGQVLGSGKGSVSLQDFERAGAIFVFGQNPGSNHPRMLATLQAAKRAGAVIVAVNPLDETGLKRYRNPQELSGVLSRGTPLADLKLRVRVNGDVPLVKGLAKHLLAAEDAGGGVLDREFIERHTQGFEAYREDIVATTWEDIERYSGVPREDIGAAARVAIESPATICCWAMGLTQHQNAVDNVREIVNFLLLRGNLGKPGAGVCPVRGHSNVQGDRTMGIWERPSDQLLDALAREFAFEPPRRPGVNAVEAIQGMHAGRIKFLFAMGGNFMRAAPDGVYTARALANCELTVQVSTKLNHSHLHTGRSALILPALGRTEIDRQRGRAQFVTCENSMGVVQPSRGALEPASAELKSDVRIIAELARVVLGAADDVDWAGLADDYDRIRDHIGRVIPGFEDLNRRLAEQGSICLPHPVRDERCFPTMSGRAEFTVHPTAPVVAPPGRYLLTTLRTHDQFNTTIYTDNDRYRGIEGSRRVLFIHRDDAADAGLEPGAGVAITSHFDGEQRSLPGFRIVPYDIPRGCVAAYYPETNDLVPIGSYAADSMTPAYKSVVVSLAAE